MEIPIYKAIELRNGEYIRGYYYTDEDETHQLIHVNQFGGMHIQNIDVSTIEISFDCGRTWDSIKNVKKI